jgi:hypothetical protein
MDSLTLALLISGAGLFLSWTGSALIVGVRWGNVQTRLTMLEHQQSNLATKDQLAGLKEDVAEIKGMFRMVPVDGQPAQAPVSRPGER